MKRFALLATAAATLAIPAGAMAANTNTGVVLSTQRHSLQVVNAGHAVNAYSYKSKLPRLHAGSEIKFSLAGHAISNVRVVGVERTVSYYAHVVRTSAGQIVLGLSDGKTVSFTPSQIARTSGHLGHAANDEPIAHAASGVTLTLNLPPGTNVLVTEKVAKRGNVSIELTIVPANAGGGSGSGTGSSGSGTGSSGNGGSGNGGSGNGGNGGNGGGSGSSANDQQASGTVTDIQVSSFGIVTNGQTASPMRFEMNAELLASYSMSACDTVTVSYHESGGANVADNVVDSSVSDAGACDSDGTYYDTQDEYGPITSISDSSITIDTDDQGSMTYPLLPSASLSTGFVIGDQVDVTYTQNPDGTLFVTDVEYVENDSTGVVTSVSNSQMTISVDSTGQSDVFSAGLEQTSFEGFPVGDEVDVTWHPAAGNAMVADGVDDLSPALPTDSGNAGGLLRLKRGVRFN